MYYSVLIETTEKIGASGRNRQYYELDNTDLADIERRIIQPYLLKKGFQFDGYFLRHDEIRRIAVKETEETTIALSDCLEYLTPFDVANNIRYSTDITNIVFDRVQLSLATSRENNDLILDDIDRSKIFIVHGRDDLAKTEIARFVEKLGLNAVILHEQASSGNTVIEKIEEHTNVGFAIVLYTPCDEGNLVGETPKARARQNVVFEHGYLIGKLGRDKVCALVKGDVEKPNDINGVVYIVLDGHGAWKMHIVKELRTAGYDIDMNKILL